MTNSIIHDFGERLLHSQSLGKEPAWVEFYRRIWPEMLACVRLDADSPLQRAGIDRAIFLPRRHQPIYIDEKIRGKDWGDFLLEEWSVLGSKKIGWSLDPSKVCDFVAYAVPGKCWLLPFEPLRIACTTHLEQWKTRKGAYPKDAPNKGWTTRNCAVPWDDLWAAIRRVSTRKWGSDLQLPRPETNDGQIVFSWASP
jgi:hypothetical protein